jgi:hypothetical protein
VSGTTGKESKDEEGANEEEGRRRNEGEERQAENGTERKGNVTEIQNEKRGNLEERKKGKLTRSCSWIRALINSGSLMLIVRFESDGWRPEWDSCTVYAQANCLDYHRFNNSSKVTREGTPLF